MTKRRLILGLLVLGIFAVLIFAFTRPGEPTYHGRTLSYWVQNVGLLNLAGQPFEPEAPEAIREIGTKAVPYLLKWMQYERPKTPPWRQTLDGFCRPHRSLRWLATDEDGNLTKDKRASGAPLAFEFVGPGADNAIPTLRRFLNGPREHRAHLAIFALGRLGPDALPPLVNALTNQDRVIRWLCIEAILDHKSNAAPALPALVHCLTDPDEGVRWSASRGLGEIRLNPALVVPPLISRLHDPDLRVRTTAADALGGFGKDAAAAASALRQTLQDPDAHWNASNALLKIAPEVLTNGPQHTTPPPP